ncbi:MAG: porin [Bacteroidia bacterium]|nr:porin [Bacteroidia bacterium]
MPSVLALILGLNFFPKVVIADSIPSPIVVSAYFDLYYAYDFNQPGNHIRLPFAYSYNRHNEPNLNLGSMKGACQAKRIRANLALMAGSYSMDNLAAEPGLLKHILEANIGLKLSKSKNLWLDAGVFPSHIGFESAISKDCWNVTRSMMADNTPYYESGLKLSYISKNEKWQMAFLLLNGWQRMRIIKQSLIPSAGHQLVFKPNDKVLLNSSSYFGNQGYDSAILMRYYHNLYAQFQLLNRLGLTLGFDLGAQQKFTGSKTYSVWYSPAALLRFQLTSRLFASARGEFFSDAAGVVIFSSTPSGFQTWSYSVNLDYFLTKNLLWRMEGRGFTAKDAIFHTDQGPKSQNWMLLSSLAWSF